MVFLSKKPAKLGTRKIEDCWEQWPLNAPDDQTWILDTLKNYRERTNKDVFIVAGDPHIGCFTKIFKYRRFVVEQMITSPITQKPPTDFEAEVMKFLLGVGTKLKNNYTFRHYKGTNSNNFGLV